MTTAASENALSEKMPFRMTVGFALVILAAVAGFHPWAVAQIRSVVQEENRVVVMQQDTKTDKQFADLARRIGELTGEVRGLKVIILSRAVK